MSAVEWDGSPVVPVHRLPLRDADGQVIAPLPGKHPPISQRQTCGTCHDYATVTKGWHFQGGDDGRPGEPWILADRATGTQLPLSYRAWPGVFAPSAVGLNDWDFTLRFGRHLPGAGRSEPRDDLAPGRWEISGPLEADCLACHSHAAGQDHSERVRQIARENFRWAGTAASGLGDVGGIAARMSDVWPAERMTNPDDAEYRVPPSATYHAQDFDSKHRTVFQVGKPLDANCLNCHSTAPHTSERSAHVGDIHSQAGMACVDCHRNGLDHAMARGFAGQKQVSAPAVTCASCHLDGQEHSGRLGAIRAAHHGLPPIHLEKLSCTACHSGPLPGNATHAVRTAKANRIGIHGRARWDTVLPEIEEPVLAPGHDGKLAPHRALWPAYWAKLGTDGKPMPLLPEAVSAAAGDALGGERRIVAVLAAWKTLKDQGRPVLLTQGKNLFVAPDGNLGAEAVAGATTTWAWEHDGARAPLAPVPAADGTFDGDTSTFLTAALGALRPQGDACLVIGATRWRLDGDSLVSEPHAANAGLAGWGWLKAGVVTSLIDDATLASAVVTAGTPQSFTEADVARVLARLAASDTSARFAYIGRGKRWTLDGDKLVSADDAAAKAVLWPIGHDVRPARQALGAIKGCADCHTADSAFLHQQVRVSGPLAGAPLSVATASFANVDLAALDRFAGGFALRTTLKVVLAIAAACVLIGALLVLARAIAQRQGGALPGRVPLTIAAHSTLLILALSGLIAWFTGRPMHGLVLMAHNAAGALFAASLALLALVWLSDATRRGPAAIANWILALCGAVSGLSALTMMLPWADTAGQEALLSLHRSAAIAALVAWLAAGALKRVKTA